MIKPWTAVFLLLVSGLSVAQEKPPLNYESWGVCPFECCTYRDWTSEEDTPVHRSRDDKSPVVFHLQRDEQVTGLTGVVVTEKPMIVTIDKTIEDGFKPGEDVSQLTLHTGDVVYFLAPLGEGNFTFWYHGKVYQSGDGLRTMPRDDQYGAMTWWKLVRNSKGKMGWTRSTRFKNVDACG